MRLPCVAPGGYPSSCSRAIMRGQWLSLSTGADYDGQFAAMKKEAEAEARLNALLAQQERVDEETRTLQAAKEEAQAQGSQREKMEKKAKKSKGGSSQKDR